MYVRFDALDQLRRDLADAVLLGVLSHFLEDHLFRFTPCDELTPTLRVYLGAFQDFSHGLTPFCDLINYNQLYNGC